MLQVRQSASPAADPALDTIDENKAAERDAETVTDAPAQEILDAVTSMGFSIHAGATSFFIPSGNRPQSDACSQCWPRLLR